MEFSNNNPNNLSLAEIRKEAYKQGRQDALTQLLERLAHFNDTKNGNEHFLNGIETCREMIEAMKGENG